MSRFDAFVSNTGWYDRAAWDPVQEACWLVPGEDGIALRRERYAPFFQQMGADVRIDQGCRFSLPWRIALDDGARLNREVIIEGSSAVRIGRNARIGHRVFFHSANHDVSPGAAEAYFERPHAFLPVWIGDNVLVSANVAILPGACIDSGSFVAAGAVVTSKRYAGPVQMAGVPAKPLRSSDVEPAPVVQPAPEVVFLAPQGKTRTLEALKLLAIALACPQLTVLSDDTRLPPGVKAVIAFDNAAIAADPAIPFFAVRAGQPIETSGQPLLWNLPAKIERAFVINGFGCSRNLANTAAATYFYASNNYLKGTPEKRAEVAGEWAACIALALVEAKHGSIWQEALARLEPPLVQGAGKGLISSDTLNALIERELMRMNVAALSEFFKEPTEKSFSKVRAQFHGAPHLLTLWTFAHKTRDPKICAAFIEFMRPHMNTAVRLAALGSAYAVMSEDGKARKIIDTLLGDAWSIDDSCLVRVLPESGAAAVQPSVAGLMIWALCREPGAGSVVPRSQALALSWEAVAPLRTDAADLLSGGLLDREKRAISVSLLENWLLLQELPEAGEAHYYLANTAYQDPCAQIEAAWRTILKEVVWAAGCPYLTLQPWPSGYAFALSLRYDVDRDCSAAQGSNILRIQKQHLKAPCGSWYFFAEAGFNAHVRNILRGWNQEDARHFCRPGEGYPGGGATAHSGPNSEYWKGRSTAEGLAEAGAAYGEGMLSRWGVARPGWLGESRSDLWLTPLHFPLEGAVNEKTTDYFDQRLQAFRSQIASGGHVIIGSHPDCNQDILDEILEREDLTGVWAVPVAVAVQRCKAVLGYGAVRLVDGGPDPDVRTLLSNNTIGDLALDVWLPGETVARTITTQLNAGVPRAVRITPAP